MVHCLEVIKARNELAVLRSKWSWLEDEEPQKVALGFGNYTVSVCRCDGANGEVMYGVGMRYVGESREVGSLVDHVERSNDRNPNDMFVMFQNAESALVVIHAAEKAAGMFGDLDEAMDRFREAALRSFAKRVADVLFAAGHRTDGVGPLAELRKAALTIAAGK